MGTKDRAGAAWLAAVLASGTGGLAQAVELGTYSIDPTKVDGTVVPGFYPNLELGLTYDDNVLRSDTGEIKSMMLEVRPELQWVAAFGKHLARLGYQGYYAHYEEISSEDFGDHFIGGDVTLDVTQKLNLNLTADFRHEHEDRSTVGGVAPPPGSGPNVYEQWAVAGEAVYGRRIATAQIALKALHRDRHFTNNGQFARDYEADGVTLTFYYNLGPKTQLLVEPSYTEYDYPNSPLDNDVTKLLVGVTWDATAKTTGKFKIGRHEKDFDNFATSANGLSMEGIVIWRPRTYSTVTARLLRDVDDSALGGLGGPTPSLYYEALIASVDWEHELTALTELQAGFRVENHEYDRGREDDYVDVYVGLSYALKRWLTVGARLEHWRRDSSVPGDDFKDNRITIGIKTALQ